MDLLAYHKMNVLQWHLTDDQGWRSGDLRNIRALTSIGAWRAGWADGDGGDARSGQRSNNDGSPGGMAGFTRRMIFGKWWRMAGARQHVTIVPEIEMPGHATAALAAYPGLACTDGPFEVGTRWGVFKDVYDPSKETTFDFIEGVLDEVCELFPGGIGVHVGGG